MPFRRASEPGSIFDHVARHVPGEGPGLLEGGDALPDDEAHGEGGIRFAPGALEGTFVRFGAELGDDDAETADDKADPADEVGALHAALVRLADRPGPRSRRAVSALFREGAARWLLDPLRERLAAFPPRDPDRLYSELRSIVLESGHREEVKYAMVLLSGFGRPDDAELFHVLGRHEEFTLYAAVALGGVFEDPVPEWKRLLLAVSGWGRTELAELMLEDPTPETREFLVRHGLGIGNELTLAVGCRLDEVLGAREVDDELLVGAGRILASLAEGLDSPDELYDYEQGATAVERFLAHVATRPPTLEQFIHVDDVRTFLEGPQPTDDPELYVDHDAELLRCGFDADRRRRALETCAELLDGPEWRALAERAVANPGFAYWPDFEAAKRLGVPLHDVVVERLEADPADGWMWHELVADADRERIEEALALAGRLLDLDALATGPALDFVGRTPELRSLDFLLQELDRFPGLGWDLLRTGLRSPVIRHRNIALRALSAWPRATLSAEVEAAVRSCLDDPDPDVRASAAAVLRGEPIPDVDLDVDDDSGEADPG